MSLQEPIYDLGEIDLTPAGRRGAAAAAAAGGSRRTGPRAIAFSVPSDRSDMGQVDWPAGLSALLPGTGHLASGRIAAGLGFVSFLGLVAALGWALHATMDRVAPTLVLLGYSRAGGAWALASLFVAAGLLHIGAVVTAGGRTGGGAPAPLAAITTGLLPGLGQALQGRRAHAGLFLAGAWLAGFAWLLAAPPVVAMLADLRLVLPAPLEMLASPASRWTLPAVLWALAVYDAAHVRTAP